jgi:hypothetical protein
MFPDQSGYSIRWIRVFQPCRDPMLRDRLRKRRRPALVAYLTEEKDRRGADIRNSHFPSMIKI